MRRARAIDAAVRAYRRGPLLRATEELSNFAEEPTLKHDVSRAGLAQRFNGTRYVRYSHQSRIPAASLVAAREALLASDLRSKRTFHELFQTIQVAIGDLPRIGELMVYDTALRIGAKLSLEPDRVYLHRGTRDGARKLGLNWRADWIPVKDPGAASAPAPLAG
jgi:hypothetical protein